MNWEVAVLLRDELQKDGMKVVMTKRSEGEFITNKDRAAIANESDADCVQSLALGELERAPCFGPAVFLALDDARVAGEEAAAL